jgi:choline-sulfatase
MVAKAKHTLLKSKPNIVWIVADQLTPLLTGVYGHPIVQTPNLNRLASTGVRFDAAYSPCPVCAPARASMLTGKFVSNIGVYDNAAPFRADEPTIAHYLTMAGFDTALSGKMHFIGPDQLHGFRARFTLNLYAADFAWVPKRGLQPEDSAQVEYTGPTGHAFNYLGEAVKVGKWSQFLSFDEETHFRALEYLHAQGLERENAGNKDQDPQPFFLCVSYTHPHEPFWPPKEYWDIYEDAEIEIPEFPKNLEETYSTLDKWLNEYHSVDKPKTLRDPKSMKRVRRAYYALVSYIDHKVGELLDSIDANGLAENTIVIFTSDHGDMLLERGMVQKRTFYEMSSRVPLIISHPKLNSVKAVNNKPVNLIDIVPTLLDFAGVDPEERLPMDGQSLLPIMTGDEESERVVFSEYHSQGSHAPCFMVRQGQYKYVYIHGFDSQLFDLENDPSEWRNLSGQPAYHELEEVLRAKVLDQFDPEWIERDVMDGIRKRELIKQAMGKTHQSWDFQPYFDSRKNLMDQYLADKNSK